MSLALREFDHFVLDGRAITGADPGDFPSVKRRKSEILADDFMCFGIRVSEVTDNPVFKRFFCAKGKRDRNFIPWLGCESCPIDGIFMEPHRSACFQPKCFETQVFQALAQQDGRRFVGSSSGVALESDMDEAV